MARLTTPEGAFVNVADEKVERLVKQGYKPADKPKSTAKKASSSKSEK